MAANDVKVKTIQAIVVLKDSTPSPKELVMAGMTMLHQYNPESPNYVQEYEAKKFKEHWQSWIKDNEMEQVVQQSVPLSIFGNGEEVLVLGPFTADDIIHLLSNCKKIGTACIIQNNY
ncbi:hypothetical protein [Salmonella phage SD-6_S16]|nr:hypothetical protein [Salmonella phage SD-6_S16]